MWNEVSSINKIASLRELEFTSHGFLRPFRYWSYKNKTALANKTFIICELLTSFGYKMSIGYGTTLGLIRDGDFIEHDDDIDIHAIIKSSETLPISSFIYEQNNIILKILLDNNINASKCNTHVKIEFFENYEKFNLDIFPTIEHNGDLKSAVVHKGRVASGDVFEIDYYLYGDISLPIPKEPQKYCEGVYGKDWKTPINIYEHKWTS
jgi:hypothetical protein